jgi:arylsulfatase A-like enzyme
VGEFIETLKAQGLYDNTLLVVTSDHGECFGEHRVLTHSVEVYENAVKIPILVKYPGQEHKGEVRNERVSILDIFGTVFDVLRLPLPAVTAQPLDKVTHAIMIENYNPGIQRGTYDSGMKRALTVIYSGDYKYTHSTTGRNELYDLAADPEELDDLVNKKPDVAARLEAKVQEYLAKTPAFSPAPSTAAPHEAENRAGVTSAGSITD